MRPLGFRFDADSVVLDGVAHTADCALLPAPLPPDAVRVEPGQPHFSERRPRECGCAPPFVTILGYELETATKPSVS
jgi:hypothetical protein